MTDWHQVLRAAARKYHLDPTLADAQIGQESGFNPNAHSPAGAQGIAQIMPGTAKGWGVDPMDPYAALDAYAKNMSGYVQKYGTRGALIAYNAGPGAVGRANLPAETVDYINKIMGAGGHNTPAPSTAYNAAVRRATGGPLQSSTGPNLFTQMSQATPVNVAGTSPQLQQLQQTTAKNYQIMGSIQDALMNAANRRALGNSQGTSDFDTSSQAAPPEGGGKGIAKFEGKPVAGWIAPILAYARQQGWKGGVNSGFRSDAEQTRIYKSGVRPAAVPKSMGGGGSNHEGSEFPLGAVDVSEAAQLAEILKRSKYANLLVWAGDKDPVHFSHPHNGSY